MWHNISSVLAAKADETIINNLWLHLRGNMILELDQKVGDNVKNRLFVIIYSRIYARLRNNLKIQLWKIYH